MAVRERGNDDMCVGGRFAQVNLKHIQYIKNTEKFFKLVFMFTFPETSLKSRVKRIYLSKCCFFIVVLLS